MKSFMASPSTIEREWYVVDATGHTLGRLASEIATILRGKNKPTYTPHIDTGDNVIVINAEKIKVTGKKLDQKIYYHHSDYVGASFDSFQPETVYFYYITTLPFLENLFHLVRQRRTEDSVRLCHGPANPSLSRQFILVHCAAHITCRHPSTCGYNIKW